MRLFVLPATTGWCARVLCSAFLLTVSSTAFAQTTGAVGPSPAPADEPAAKPEMPPPGGCTPIGVTVSGEIVFPFQCKDFIERMKSSSQRPVPPEKPAVADGMPSPASQKFPVAEDKSSSDDKPVMTDEKETAPPDKPAVAEQPPAPAEQKPAEQPPVVEQKPVVVDANPAAPEPKPVAAEANPAAPEPKPVAAETNPAAPEPKPVAAEAKPAAPESKPVAAEEKPAAPEQKPVANAVVSPSPSAAVEDSSPAIKPGEKIPLPRRAADRTKEPRAKELKVTAALCTHFRSYNAAAGTYKDFSGKIRPCR